VKMMTDQKNRRRAGLSLVELMVSVAVMGFVTAQLLYSFSKQHTSSLEHERVIEIQEEARLIADVILQDLRVGGFMVPRWASVASLDGGTSGPDVLCVSDSTVIDDSILASASERLDGATISTAFSGSTSSVAVSSGTLDIDGDGDNDFSTGEGVIIATGDESHCAIVTGISGSTISFTPSTDSGFVASVDDAVVPALVYTVSGTTLSRNSTVLSNHIEDLQVEFGIDIDIDGTVEASESPSEFPIDDPTGQDFELIENVRIHLTARDLRNEPTMDGQFAAVANRVAGSADNFKRRRVIGDAVMRNMR